MKIKDYLKKILLLVTSATTVITIQSPGQAENVNFVCAQASDNTPTTYVETPRGPIPLFNWRSQYFKPPYTPMGRCQEVAQRLNIFQSQGILKDFRSGTHNGYAVMCASSCNADGSNIVYTMKPGQNAEQELQKLQAHKEGATSEGIDQSEGTLQECSPPDVRDAYAQSIKVENGSVVFNLESYISNAPVDNCSDLAGNSSVTTPPQNTPPTSSPGNVWGN